MYLQRDYYARDQKMKSKWKIHLGATHRAVGSGPFHPFSVDIPSTVGVCLYVCPFSEGDCQPVGLPSTPPSLVLLSLHFWHPPDIRCSARTHMCTHTLLHTLTSCHQQFNKLPVYLLQQSFLDGVNKHRTCTHMNFGEVARINPSCPGMKMKKKIKKLFLF